MAVAGLPNHMDAFLLQKPGKTFPHHLVVVYQQNADGGPPFSLFA